MGGVDGHRNREGADVGVVDAGDQCRSAGRRYLPSVVCGRVQSRNSCCALRYAILSRSAGLIGASARKFECSTGSPKG